MRHLGKISSPRFFLIFFRPLKQRIFWFNKDRISHRGFTFYYNWQHSKYAPAFVENGHRLSHSISMINKHKVRNESLRVDIIMVALNWLERIYKVWSKYYQLQPSLKIGKNSLQQPQVWRSKPCSVDFQWIDQLWSQLSTTPTQTSTVCQSRCYNRLRPCGVIPY